jgi:hypothetical protein
MPLLSGRSLSRGHERSPHDAAASMLHPLSRFPAALLGTVLFVPLLGMSNRALAAVTYVTTASYSASGELFEVDGAIGNKTEIHEQNSTSVSANGPSTSVSLALSNKQFSLGGAGADVFASAHAGIGALGVDAFASATVSTYTAEAGPETEADASFSDVVTFGWKDPKKLGKPVVLRATIHLHGGFSHTNTYLFSRTYPPGQDYVTSISQGQLSVVCSLCGALPNEGVLGDTNHEFDGGFDLLTADEDNDPPETIQINKTVASGVPIPVTLAMDVRSSASSDNRDTVSSFGGAAETYVNFKNTLALGPITFIDPSTGLALSESDFSLVSASGYDYLHPPDVMEPPAVPEPPIYVLLLCGLLAISASVTNKPRVRYGLP